MIGGGMLIAGGAVAGLGPIALVSGVLLLWSGIVKAIVLRIWHTTLSAPSVPAHERRDRDSGTAIGQRT
jgi:hypothetical protein